MSGTWLASQLCNSTFSFASSDLGFVPGRTLPRRSRKLFCGLLSCDSGSMYSLLVTGSQKSGMPQPASLAPKNPGGATPITVHGCPLIWEPAPATEGSEPDL